MSKPNSIIHGSIDRKITSSDLIEERAKKDFTGSLREVLSAQTYVRMDEAVAFIESHPELANSHKFYDMSRQEQ